MFITGCHRSGTSLITSIFKDFINEQVDGSKLITPQLDNPLGFFESKKLVHFNEQLLKLIGSSCSSPPITLPLWTEPPLIDFLINARKDFKDLAMSSTWVDKDPRLCMLYPAYFHILLKRVPLLICIREPIKVAVSLYARTGLSINVGLSMWFIYNHHISKLLTNDDSFYFYEEFINISGDKSKMYIYEQCCKTIEPMGIKIPSFDKFQKVLDNRIKGNLNRCSSLALALNKNICNLELLNTCNNAYQKFHSSKKDLNIYQELFMSIPSNILNILYEENKLNIPCSKSEIKNNYELVNLRKDYNELEVKLHSSKYELVNLRKDYKELEVKLHSYKEDLRVMQTTFSWKLTYPLRYLKNKIKSLLGGPKKP